MAEIKLPRTLASRERRMTPEEEWPEIAQYVESSYRYLKTMAITPDNQLQPDLDLGFFIHELLSEFTTIQFILERGGMADHHRSFMEHNNEYARKRWGID